MNRQDESRNRFINSRRATEQSLIYHAKESAMNTFLLQSVRWCAFSMFIDPADLRIGARPTYNERYCSAVRKRLLKEVRSYLGKQFFTDSELESAVDAFAKRRAA